MRTSSSVAASLVLMLAFGVTWAGDWPGFQGPSGNGIANETGLMKTWPASGPKILWTVPVGPGFGGVASRDGDVYLLDRATRQEDILRCLDLATGKERWRYAYAAPGRINTPGSRSTPAVDDKHVYTVGPFGHLHCVSRATHKPVWKTNILAAFDGKNPTWAISQSPALYKNTVIVAPVGRKAGVVAFDRNTGNVVWRSKPLRGGISYASPVIATLAGVDQVVVITGGGTTGVDANTGTVLWTSGDWTCKLPITSAAAVGDGRVFVTGGYGAGAAMLKVSRAGDRFNVKTLFKTKAVKCQIHQPLLYKGHLYLNGNDKAKREGFICMDLNGKVLWKTGKQPGFDWGGLLLADGRIYTVDGTRGDLCMIDPDPSGYREVARAKMLSGKKIWGPIAMADGKVLLRDQKQLRCVDVRGK